MFDHFPGSGGHQRTHAWTETAAVLVEPQFPGRYVRRPDNHWNVSVHGQGRQRDPGHVLRVHEGRRRRIEELGSDNDSGTAHRLD